MNIGQMFCPSCRSAIVVPQGNERPVSIRCATCGLEINLSVRSDQAHPTMSQPTSQALERRTRWGIVLGLSLGGGILLLILAVGLALWLAAPSTQSDVTRTSQSDEPPPRQQETTANLSAAPVAPQSAPADQEDSNAKTLAQDESKRIQEESKKTLEPKRTMQEVMRARREVAEKKSSAIPLVESLDKLDLSPSD